MKHKGNGLLISFIEEYSQRKAYVVTNEREERVHMDL